jgi:RNA-splicing ligase RtcB
VVTKINDRLYSWASEIDDNTIQQAEMTARLPIVAGHVALMADAHLGVGSTVGSVIPTAGAVIPSAVGVDIGCGMAAVETGLTSSQLPDDLAGLLFKIEEVIPAGVGKGLPEPSTAARTWLHRRNTHEWLDRQSMARAASQLGTLGSGNHFVEVCVDEHETVWLMLHSGSRGIGHQLAQRHIARSKELARELGLELEHQDLAYLSEGTPDFNEYIRVMLWAQGYAAFNRQLMLRRLVQVFEDFTGLPVQGLSRVVNCHHNFTRKETWDDREVWVTRKGAISAREGELGIIPGSMGTGSFIVKGRGNRLSWASSSHGAGRRMSRAKARKTFTAESLTAAMGGRTWLKNDAAGLVDESPGAYKDIGRVMADQTDLVEVVASLTQILNYKGL